MVDIGAVIVYPNLFSPWVTGSWLVVEEKHICLYTLCIKNTGWQTQDGMQFGCFHKLFTDCFPCSTFKKDIIWEHHCCLTSDFEQAADMLEEVELFIAGGCPKILTVVAEILLLLFPLFIGDCHTALLAERRISQHIVHPHTLICNKRIIR